MLKRWKMLCAAVLFTGCFLSMGCVTQAKDNTIEKGITIGNIDVSGMTVDAATQKIEDYVSSLKDVKINLNTVNKKTVTVTASDLGISWDNTDVVEQAGEVGKLGNIVQKYKALLELKSTNKVYPVTLKFSNSSIEKILNEKCAKYNQKAVNASLTHSNGAFQIVQGQTGYTVNVTKSEEAILDYLKSSWNGSNATIDLTIDEEQPKGNADTLSKIKDVLGTYTTAYKTSSQNRCNNIANGCKLINGTTLYPGEQLSVLNTITPFSDKNGYSMAGSYLNGQIVESFGGGICQVSTTLYNAVIRAELQVDERSNHSMIVNYVKPSEDAAIAEGGGKDLKFTNNLKYPVYIEGITGGKTITFTVYGVESRDAGRSVGFQSEVLETNVPTTTTVVQDATHPIGYVDVTQAVHIGYKARLWKVVSENGKEVSRQQLNSSTYKAVPETVTVGTATADPNAASQLQAAIATSNLDQIKAVVASITGVAPAVGTQPATTGTPVATTGTPAATTGTPAATTGTPAATAGTPAAVAPD